MSTEKIDVLSVMRCVTATVLQGEARSCMREDMDKARAAVEELIVMSGRLAFFAEDTIGADGALLTAAANVRKILARVQARSD